MAFHAALLRMLLERQDQLIWIVRLRSCSVMSCQKFGNVVLQQNPRSIQTDLGRRQTLLANHLQHRRFCDTQERCHFTDAQFTSRLSFPFAVNFDRVAIAH